VIKKLRLTVFQDSTGFGNNPDKKEIKCKTYFCSSLVLAMNLAHSLLWKVASIQLRAGAGENGLATGHKNVDKELTNESNIPRRCCK
jgi:hypothetical protein